MKTRNILLIGGSGFVGSHLAHLLAARGDSVTVPTRRRERAKDLIMLPTVEVVEADVTSASELARLAAGKDAVVNLVGILHSRNGTPYGRDFAQAHVELPKAVVVACARAGVARLVHMSALKADRGAPSQYLRSKADGEAAVMGAGKEVGWSIVRPSVIFGHGDSFLNMFADLARAFPVLPLACPQARFQPVWVEDVVATIAECLDRPEATGQRYDLCGPKVYTLRQLVEYVGGLVGRPRPIVGLSQGLSHLQALMLEFAPGGLMSRDNIASMKVDSVCEGCTLPFGRSPMPLESIAPGYLAAHVHRARYNPFRTRARR